MRYHTDYIMTFLSTESEIAVTAPSSTRISSLGRKKNLHPRDKPISTSKLNADEQLMKMSYLKKKILSADVHFVPFRLSFASGKRPTKMHYGRSKSLEIGICENIHHQAPRRDGKCPMSLLVSTFH